MTRIVINPRTGNPLNGTARSILDHMGGAVGWSRSHVERKWPINDIRFGTRSKEAAALVTLAKAGLIESAENGPIGDEVPANLRYWRITDAGRAIVAPEIARIKESENRRREESEAQEAERRSKEAEARAKAKEIARAVEAFPDLLAALINVIRIAEEAVEVREQSDDAYDRDTARSFQADIDRARAVIAKAQGEK